MRGGVMAVAVAVVAAVVVVAVVAAGLPCRGAHRAGPRGTMAAMMTATTTAWG